MDAKLQARAAEITNPSYGYWETQRDIIRDVMNAANEFNVWLTLGELHNLTFYSEASISAQLRHLRHPENGGYRVTKRKRGSDFHKGKRMEVIFEYWLSSVAAVSAERAEMREEKRVGA